jgi:hypothetical protein
VRQAVRLRLARFQEEHPDQIGAVMLAEYREYDDFHIIIVNVQTDTDEFDAFLSTFINHLGREAREEDLDVLRRLYTQRIRTLKAIWSHRSHELCAAAAVLAARIGTADAVGLDQDTAAVERRVGDVVAMVNQALRTDGYFMAGNGPAHLSRIYGNGGNDRAI